MDAPQTNPIPTNVNKSHTGALVSLAVIITLIVAGGGVYAWQYMVGQEKDGEIQRLNGQNIDLNNQVSLLQKEAEENVKQNEEIVNKQNLISRINSSSCSDDLSTILKLQPWLVNFIPEEFGRIKYCLSDYGSWGLLSVNSKPDYKNKDYGDFYIKLINIKEQSAQDLHKHKLSLYQGCEVIEWSTLNQITYKCNAGDGGAVFEEVYVVSDWFNNPEVEQIKRCNNDSDKFVLNGPLICNEWTDGDWCEPGEEYGDNGSLNCLWLIP